MRALLLGCLFLIVPGSAAAFDPHEHKLMADFGAALAFEQAPDDLKLPWRDAKGERWVKALEANDGARWLARPKATCHSTHENAENLVQKTGIAVWAGSAPDGQWFTFGDLVAIYGDLREQVECDAKTFSCPLGPSSGFRHFKELTGEYPHSRLGLKTACLNDPECRRFLERALYNKTHFGIEGIKAYQRNHEAAFFWMVKSITDRDRRFMWMALHAEAMALHSLTDLFASGHILFDRDGATALTLRVGFLPDDIKLVSGVLSPGGIAGALQGQVHNAFNESGLRAVSASDSVSREWKAYGDDQLHRSWEQMQKVWGAVSESLKSLFRAYAELKKETSTPAILAKAQALVRGANLWSATARVPVLYRNACVNVLVCYAKDQFANVPHYEHVKGLWKNGRLP